MAFEAEQLQSRGSGSILPQKKNWSLPTSFLVAFEEIITLTHKY